MTIGDYQKLLDFSSASIVTNNLEVSKNFMITSILTVNPVEAGTVVIPDYSTVIYITNTAPYINLSLQLPSNPHIGKILFFVSQVDISNIFFTNGTFGVTMSSYLQNSQPIRIIFTGLVWILI